MSSIETKHFELEKTLMPAIETKYLELQEPETKFVLVERSNTCCHTHTKKKEKIAHYVKGFFDCTDVLNSTIYTTEDINRLIAKTRGGFIHIMRKCECIECTAFVRTKVIKAVGTTVLVSECGTSFCRDIYASYKFGGFWDSDIPSQRRKTFTNERIDQFVGFGYWEFIGNFSC
jgi:hypothetical protein